MPLAFTQEDFLVMFCSGKAFVLVNVIVERLNNDTIFFTLHIYCEKSVAMQ